MSYELRPYQLESVEAVNNLQPNFNTKERGNN